MEKFIPVHVPVLKREIIGYFSQIPKKETLYFLDGTAGEGGHSELILSHFKNAKLIMIDRDPEMLERSVKRVDAFKDRIHPMNLIFSEFMPSEIEEFTKGNKLDGILLDLGISTYHFEQSNRGFTLKKEEPLDMRLSPDSKISAKEVVNKYKAEKLLEIFREYGEENWALKIVDKIVAARRQKPIQTTLELAKLVEATIPRKFWPDKGHPAFRVFQAIRIEVNNELFHIKKGIEKLLPFLEVNGIFCVIAFHSLEDRIVKNCFKAVEGKGFEPLTKKPVTPTDQEITLNNASRSAKLRVVRAYETTNETTAENREVETSDN